MSSRTKWLVGIIILIVIIIIISVSSKPAESNIIKIGYFGPFTGAVAGTTGEDVANGFKLAQSRQNTVDGKKIEVIYEDDSCDPTKAVSSATKLINVDRVNIIVNGVCSGSMVSVAPIAESHKVILFTPTSESPKITDAGDYIFRISASSVLSAHAMVQGLEKLKLNKIAIIFETAEYTTGMKDAFLAEFNKTDGNTVLATESFGSKDTDLRTQLVKLAKAKPDILVVFANSTITANIIANQMKDLSFVVPLIGNTYFASGPARENPNNNGNYVVVYKYDASSPEFLKLVADYKKKFGKSPAQDIYAALAYDAYNVLFSAIKQCGSDNSDCIKQALYNIKNYQGITGTITMDSNGDTIREFTMRKIQNGRLVDAQ